MCTCVDGWVSVGVGMDVWMSMCECGGVAV